MAMDFECDLHALSRPLQLDCVSETEVLDVQAGALCTPRLKHVNNSLLFRMCVQRDCMRQEFAY